MFCCSSCDLVLLVSALEYFNEGNVIFKKMELERGTEVVTWVFALVD